MAIHKEHILPSFSIFQNEENFEDEEDDCDNNFVISLDDCENEENLSSVGDSSPSISLSDISQHNHTKATPSERSYLESFPQANKLSIQQLAQNNFQIATTVSSHASEQQSSPQNFLLLPHVSTPQPFTCRILDTVVDSPVSNTFSLTPAADSYDHVSFPKRTVMTNLSQSASGNVAPRSQNQLGPIRILPRLLPAPTKTSVETIQLDQGAGGIWSEALILSTSSSSDDGFQDCPSRVSVTGTPVHGSSDSPLAGGHLSSPGHPLATSNTLSSSVFQSYGVPKLSGPHPKYGGTEYVKYCFTQSVESEEPCMFRNKQKPLCASVKRKLLENVDKNKKLKNTDVIFDSTVSTCKVNISPQSALNQSVLPSVTLSSQHFSHQNDANQQFNNFSKLPQAASNVNLPTVSLPETLKVIIGVQKPGGKKSHSFSSKFKTSVIPQKAPAATLVTVASTVASTVTPVISSNSMPALFTHHRLKSSPTKVFLKPTEVQEQGHHSSLPSLSAVAPIFRVIPPQNISSVPPLAVCKESLVTSMASPIFTSIPSNHQVVYVAQDNVILSPNKTVSQPVSLLSPRFKGVQHASPQQSFHRPPVTVRSLLKSKNGNVKPQAPCIVSGPVAPQGKNTLLMIQAQKDLHSVLKNAEKIDISTPGKMVIQLKSPNKIDSIEAASQSFSTLNNNTISITTPANNYPLISLLNETASLYKKNNDQNKTVSESTPQIILSQMNPSSTEQMSAPLPIPRSISTSSNSELAQSIMALLKSPIQESRPSAGGNILVNLLSGRSVPSTKTSSINLVAQSNVSKTACRNGVSNVRVVHPSQKSLAKDSRSLLPETGLIQHLPIKDFPKTYTEDSLKKHKMFVLDHSKTNDRLISAIPTSKHSASSICPLISHSVTPSVKLKKQKQKQEKFIVLDQLAQASQNATYSPVLPVLSERLEKQPHSSVYPASEISSETSSIKIQSVTSLKDLNHWMPVTETKSSMLSQSAHRKKIVSTPKTSSKKPRSILTSKFGSSGNSKKKKTSYQTSKFQALSVLSSSVENSEKVSQQNTEFQALSTLSSSSDNSKITSDQKTECQALSASPVCKSNSGLKLKIRLGALLRQKQSHDPFVVMQNDKAELVTASQPSINPTIEIPEAPVAELQKSTSESVENGRIETAEEMFQRFEKQAVQEVVKAQMGMGYVSRSLRPSRTKVSFFDKYPYRFYTGHKIKKLQPKLQKITIKATESQTKIEEPISNNKFPDNVNSSHVRNVKSLPRSKRVMEEIGDDHSATKHPRLSIRGCPRLEEDSSISDPKKLYCSNILAGHKVFVKFNVFENTHSGRAFLIPFFNLGGTRTQFDVEDMEYISKAVVDFEKGDKSCARHLLFFSREGRKAAFLRKETHWQTCQWSESHYKKTSFILEGFKRDTKKPEESSPEVWKVDNAVDIEIDRAEVDNDIEIEFNTAVEQSEKSNECSNMRGDEEVNNDGMAIGQPLSTQGLNVQLYSKRTVVDSEPVSLISCSSQQISTSKDLNSVSSDSKKTAPPEHPSIRQKVKQELTAEDSTSECYPQLPFYSLCSALKTELPDDGYDCGRIDRQDVSDSCSLASGLVESHHDTGNKNCVVVKREPDDECFDSDRGSSLQDVSIKKNISSHSIISEESIRQIEPSVTPSSGEYGYSLAIKDTEAENVLTPIIKNSAPKMTLTSDTQVEDDAASIETMTATELHSSESPLPSSVLSESSDISESSEIDDGEYDSESESSVSLTSPCIPEGAAEDVNTEGNLAGVNNKITSLVESLRSRLTNNTSGLPPWLGSVDSSIPKAKFKKRKRAKKRRAVENVSVTDTLSTPGLSSLSSQSVPTESPEQEQSSSEINHLSTLSQDSLYPVASNSSISSKAPDIHPDIAITSTSSQVVSEESPCQLSEKPKTDNQKIHTVTDLFLDASTVSVQLDGSSSAIEDPLLNCDSYDLSDFVRQSPVDIEIDVAEGDSALFSPGLTSRINSPVNLPGVSSILETRSESPAELDIEVGLDDLPEMAMNLKPILPESDYFHKEALQGREKDNSNYDLETDTSQLSLLTTAVGFRSISDEESSSFSKQIFTNVRKSNSGLKTESVRYKKIKGKKQRKMNSHSFSTGYAHDLYSSTPTEHEHVSVTSYLSQKFLSSSTGNNRKGPRLLHVKDGSVKDQQTGLNSKVTSAHQTISEPITAIELSTTPSVVEIFGANINKATAADLNLSTQSPETGSTQNIASSTVPTKSTRRLQVSRKRVSGKNRRSKHSVSHKSHSRNVPQILSTSVTGPQVDKSVIVQEIKEETKDSSDEVKICKVSLVKLEEQMKNGRLEQLSEHVFLIKNVSNKQVTDSIKESTIEKDEDSKGLNMKPAVRRVIKKKRRKGLKRAVFKPSGDIVDYYTFMINSLRKKAQQLEDEAMKKEEEETKRKIEDEAKKQEAKKKEEEEMRRTLEDEIKKREEEKIKENEARKTEKQVAEKEEAVVKIEKKTEEDTKTLLDADTRSADYGITVTESGENFKLLFTRGKVCNETQDIRKDYTEVTDKGIDLNLSPSEDTTVIASDDQMSLLMKKTLEVGQTHFTEEPLNEAICINENSLDSLWEGHKESGIDHESIFEDELILIDCNSDGLNESSTTRPEVEDGHVFQETKTFTSSTIGAASVTDLGETNVQQVPALDSLATMFSDQSIDFSCSNRDMNETPENNQSELLSENQSNNTLGNNFRETCSKNITDSTNAEFRPLKDNRTSSPFPDFSNAENLVDAMFSDSDSDDTPLSNWSYLQKFCDDEIFSGGGTDYLKKNNGDVCLPKIQSGQIASLKFEKKDIVLGASGEDENVVITSETAVELIDTIEQDKDPMFQDDLLIDLEKSSFFNHENHAPTRELSPVCLSSDVTMSDPFDIITKVSCGTSEEQTKAATKGSLIASEDTSDKLQGDNVNAISTALGLQTSDLSNEVLSVESSLSARGIPVNCTSTLELAGNGELVDQGDVPNLSHSSTKNIKVTPSWERLLGQNSFDLLKLENSNPGASAPVKPASKDVSSIVGSNFTVKFKLPKGFLSAAVKQSRLIKNTLEQPVSENTEDLNDPRKERIFSQMKANEPREIKFTSLAKVITQTLSSLSKVNIASNSNTFTTKSKSTTDPSDLKDLKNSQNVKDNNSNNKQQKISFSKGNELSGLNEAGFFQNILESSSESQQMITKTENSKLTESVGPNEAGFFKNILEFSSEPQKRTTEKELALSSSELTGEPMSFIESTAKTSANLNTNRNVLSRKRTIRTRQSQKNTEINKMDSQSQASSDDKKEHEIASMSSLSLNTSDPVIQTSDTSGQKSSYQLSGSPTNTLYHRLRSSRHSTNCELSQPNKTTLDAVIEPDRCVDNALENSQNTLFHLNRPPLNSEVKDCGIQENRKEGIFSNLCNLRDSEEHSNKLPDQQSRGKRPHVDKILKKNIIDIGKLRLKLNPLIATKLSKSNLNLVPGVNISEREEEKEPKNLDHTAPVYLIQDPSHLKPMDSTEMTCINKTELINGVNTDQDVESRHPGQYSLVMETKSVALPNGKPIPQLNAAKLRSILNNFKKKHAAMKNSAKPACSPVAAHTGDQTYKTLPAAVINIDSNLHRKGPRRVGNELRSPIKDAIPQNLKTKAGRTTRKCNVKAAQNLAVQIVADSAEAETFEASQKVSTNNEDNIRTEEKGERSFIDCLSSVPLQAWEVK